MLTLHDPPAATMTAEDLAAPALHITRLTLPSGPDLRVGQHCEGIEWRGGVYRVYGWQGKRLVTIHPTPGTRAEWGEAVPFDTRR
jgi:hypothetical protein